MRTLFAKILLWFLATAVIDFVGAVFISALELNPWQSPFGRLMYLQERAARNAWETGGATALADFERRFRAGSDMSAVLTDAGGRDLLTGKDYSASLKRTHFPLSFFRPGNGVIPHRSNDGKYYFILLLPASRFGSWFLSPQALYGLGVVTLLCYLLALNLTSPLRKLQKTLEHFGQGDLTARTNSKRRDELGELSRTFDRMAERIQTLLAAERRLLLDISHEIRSPLARLGVVVELARNSDDIEGSLNRIQKEADRLNDLVGQLLQVTRAEGDREKLLHESVRLDELLETIVDDCAIEAQARSCELHLARTPADHGERRSRAVAPRHREYYSQRDSIFTAGSACRYRIAGAGRKSPGARTRPRAGRAVRIVEPDFRSVLSGGSGSQPDRRRSWIGSRDRTPGRGIARWKLARFQLESRFTGGDRASQTSYR